MVLEIIRLLETLQSLYVDYGQCGCSGTLQVATIISYLDYCGGILLVSPFLSRHLLLAKQWTKLFSSLRKLVLPVLTLLNTRNHSGTNIRLLCGILLNIWGWIKEGYSLTLHCMLAFYVLTKIPRPSQGHQSYEVLDLG